MALTLNVQPYTWDQLKARVARVVGEQNDADWLIAAGEALEDAIRDWEMKRDWDWLRVTAADITLLDDTSTYTLPTGFRKHYSARLADRKLIYVPMRYWDQARPKNDGGDTWFYTNFDQGETSKIEIRPAIGTVTAPNNVLKLRYWRTITIPTSGSTVLNVPAHHINGIISHARANILLDKGGDDVRMQMYQQKGDRALANAIRDEVLPPDWDAGFVPAGITGQNPWSANSLATLYSEYDE